MDPYTRFEKNMSLVPYVFHKKFSAYKKYEEDLIQEGYLALWKSCINFNEDLGFKFSSYAHIAILNRMVNYIQREVQKQDNVISLYSVAAENSDGDQLYFIDIIPAVQENPEDAILKECLNQVPDRDRSILIKIMEGYTQNEIAIMFNTSQASISRCLKRFKNILLEEQQNGNTKD